MHSVSQDLYLVAGESVPFINIETLPQSSDILHYDTVIPPSEYTYLCSGQLCY
uniref:Uncharacterized protein n=1 Tax=Anguilla anguilla TaxID=7936 RepID=A0A0E9V2G5_ANGAN